MSKSNSNLNQPHHIIAIGASAGGMDEINSFFDHTPLDEVSYILIQHLSPDFKSRMAEILSRHSKLQVKEAEDKMWVECNQVYLIPSDKYMTVSKGRLHLTKKEKKGGPHLTIDTFFNSLALAMGKDAIGIILSGTGADGSEGVEAIKKAGGLILVSDPTLAEFSDMPANAIATGFVDYILSPQLMPQVIEHYVRNNGVLLPEVAGINEEDQIVVAIIGLIKDHLPLDFTDYKHTTILRRIKRRAASHNFNKLSNYLSFLKTNNNEIEDLAKDFLISVTSFFRDKEAFEYIQKNIIQKIIHRGVPGEEIKFWVAGCATGEEAYSLAILLYEQLNDEYKDTTVKIFATDIDANALIHAGKGVYSEQITKDVSPERVEKFFTKEGDTYKVKSEIRRMLIFAQHDLVQNPPYCNMDFISCRNLLIYLTPSLQKKIFLMLHFGLKHHGYLFLGASETPNAIKTGLEVLSKKWKIYKNVGEKEVIRFDTFSLPALIDIKSLASLTSHDTGRHYQKNNLSDSVNEAIVSELGFLLICINEKNNVVQTYGDTTKYLLQKNFNLNLAELLPKPLAVAFFTAFKKSVQTNEKVVVKGINIKKEKTLLSVNLMVKPLDIKKGEQRLFVILFSDDKFVNSLLKGAEVFDEKMYHDQYIINLEEELKEIKYELHATFEKLDASNENMQSFNEELLSANEEMQSTNEEMESINEELHTINSDYQAKNKELIEINDDLNNYFRSNINGQLFVNSDLLLMRFSPGAVKHVNLSDTDIGRPISDISTNIKFVTIVNDIRTVIASGKVITREVESNNGKWYQMMTMPYLRQIDNKTNGAIVSFNDITALKLTQLELDRTNKNLLNINADLDNFVHTASHDLLGPLANIQLSIDVMNQLELFDDPQLHKFLEIINGSVKLFGELVREMGRIGKIENDMSVMEQVDLEPIINELTLSIENGMLSSRAVIRKDLRVPAIYFSKKNLRSILYNLISNAIKFKSPDRDPVITISTTEEKDYIVLAIEDNGIGIPGKEFDNIFKMYGRLHMNVDGQGIGLYLIRKIVNAANGKIVVRSEQGTGSVFSIHFKTGITTKLALPAQTQLVASK
ncbi:MAG: chemotaxis protein CheB [Ginsengibacter sp.]